MFASYLWDSDTSMDSLQIVQFYGANSEIAATALEILAKSRGQFDRQVLLDVGLLERAPLRRLDSWAKSRLERRHSAHPSRLLKDLATDFDFEYIQTAPSPTECAEEEASQLFREMPSTFKGLVEWDACHGTLGPALANILATQMSKHYDPDPATFRRALRTQIRSFLQVRNALLAVCAGCEASIVVQNGRLPISAAAHCAAVSRNASVTWYERGRHGFYFHESFRPHDPHGLYKLGAELDEAFTPEETKRVLSEFSSRRLDVKLNRFLASMEPSHTVRHQDNRSTSRRPQAVIFTSSPDEYLAVGGESELKWRDQYSAVKQVVAHLAETGFEVTVRVHPNLINKSWAALKAARLQLATLPSTVTLHGPTSQVNSYDLLDSADLVVVWVSTIGLEGLMSGKQVVVLAPCRYVYRTSAQEVFSPQALVRWSPVADGGNVAASRSAPAAVWYATGGRRHGTRVSAALLDRSRPFESRRRVIGPLLTPLRIPTAPLVLGSSPRYLAMATERVMGRRRSQKFLDWLIWRNPQHVVSGARNSVSAE